MTLFLQQALSKLKAHETGRARLLPSRNPEFLHANGSAGASPLPAGFVMYIIPLFFEPSVGNLERPDLAVEQLRMAAGDPDLVLEDKGRMFVPSLPAGS